MQLNTLGTRSTKILGPFYLDMLLTIKRIGSADEGVVHPLSAPVIYDYNYRHNKLMEVSSLPNAFLIKKNKKYLLSTFISGIEYSVSQVTTEVTT
jgi:hypothetical protein